MTENPDKETSENIHQMTFEQALVELEGIVKDLEADEIDLQRSIDLYDRGVKLRRHCDNKLQQARERIEMIDRESKSLVKAPEEVSGKASQDFVGTEDEDMPF